MLTYQYTNLFLELPGIEDLEMNLDDGEGDDGGPDSQEEDRDPESNSPEDETADGVADDTMEEKSGENSDSDNEESEPLDTVGQSGTSAEAQDLDEQEQNNPEEEDSGAHIEPPPKNQDSTEELHGVAAQDGKDAVKEQADQEPEDEMQDGGAEDEAGAADENIGQSLQGSGGSGNDGDWQSGKDSEPDTGTNADTMDEVPNPFRSPGDAEKVS